LRLPSFRMEAVVLHEVGTSDDELLLSNADADVEAAIVICDSDTRVARPYKASGEAKNASRRGGLGCAVLHEVGTSEAANICSNARAAVYGGFPSNFTTTKMLA